MVVPHTQFVGGPPPPLWTAFWQLCVCTVWIDLSFYWLHRAFHTKTLYWLHRQHHTYTGTVSVSASARGGAAWRGIGAVQ